MYLQSTIGEEKAYSIATLVGCLIKEKRRVVYLPGCGELCSRTHMYLLEALAMTFLDLPLVLEKLESVSDVDQIKRTLRDLIFVFDQWNAPETGLAALLYSEFTESEKLARKQRCPSSCKK